jgi:hypothetical protein
MKAAHACWAGGSRFSNLNLLSIVRASLYHPRVNWIEDLRKRGKVLLPTRADCRMILPRLGGNHAHNDEARFGPSNRCYSVSERTRSAGVTDRSTDC